MEVQSRKIQNPSSERWSLNSHHYPSGRFPKVSVGIVVEKSTKLGSGVMKDDPTTLPIPEKLSSQEKVVKEIWDPLVVDKYMESPTAKAQMISTKLSTRSTCHETQTADPVHIVAQKASDVHLGEDMLMKMNVTAEAKESDKHPKPSALFSTKSTLHETPIVEKVQYFVNQTPVLQSEVCMHQRSERIFKQKKVGWGSNSEMPELEFTSMNRLHVFDADLEKEQSDKVNKHHSERLRMKLSEILGNASQNNQTVCSANPEDRQACNESQRSKMQKAEAEVIETNQNSDTIETDSESPKESIRRPLTRSLSRNKAPPRTVKGMCIATNHEKMRLSPDSDPKKKVQDNIFAFDEEEGKAKTSSRFVNVHGNSIKRKMIKHKMSRIEPRKIHFPPRSTSENNSLSKEKEIPSPDKASLKNKKTRPSPFLPFCHEKDNLQTPNEVSNASHQLQKEANKPIENPSVDCSTENHEQFSCLKTKTSSWDYSKSKAQKETYSHRGVISTSGEKAVNHSNDFHSPTFAINANKSSCKSKLLGEDFSPIVSEEQTPTGKACRSKGLANYKSQTETPSAETESSDDSGEDRESPCMKFSDGWEETGKQSSLSPSEQQEFEHFETNDFLNEGFKRSDKWFSNASNLKRSTTRVYQREKVHTFKDKKINQSNLSTSPPCGTSRTEETENAQMHDILEQFPEDSLARTVCQLALFLQSFKNKMKLHTKKKSSEILLAAAQKASLQIKDAESQINADVGKFISSEKSKRKQLESKIEEQQKRMKIIHDKFKEEMNQHLIHCRGTLNDMEAYHVELKGCLDRQKATHGKLLQQVEESIGSHLSDAETRITTLHKEASKTMNGLKHALRECMEDQI